MLTSTLEYFPNKELRLVLSKPRFPSRVDPYLDIDSEFPTDSETGSQKEFRARRPATFNVNSKRQLQRLGGACGLEYKPSESLFLTGTFPAGTPEGQRAVAEGAHVLVKRLTSWIWKRLGDCPWFYVWELQKRGTLHLHLYVASKDAIALSNVSKDFKAEWIRLLESLGEESGVDIWESRPGFSWKSQKSVIQVYSQYVKKSVSAYLAKYCSKGFKQSTCFPSPRRWWGASQECRRLLAKHSWSEKAEFISMEEANQLKDRVESVAGASCEVGYQWRHRFTGGLTQIYYGVTSEVAGLLCQKRYMQSSEFQSEESCSQVKRSLLTLNAVLRRQEGPLSSQLQKFSLPLRKSLMGLWSSTRSYVEMTREDYLELFSCLPYLKMDRYSRRDLRNALSRHLTSVDSYSMSQLRSRFAPEPCGEHESDRGEGRVSSDSEEVCSDHAELQLRISDL